MTPELGVLKRVDVRQAWPNEARSFTPWLAQNLASLGEVLGMDLELQGQEQSVGDFSLDILARDLGRNRLVVIENQLEATDHDHLGKLLTYAAGHDAGAAVWIAKEIREEHRQAIDWLNQHSDRTIEIYAVVVELLQIDSSRPACSFKLVAFPNEWRKASVEDEGGTSTKREAYRAFFQDLIDELRDKHRFTGARLAQPQNWYSFAAGASGITFGFTFADSGRARAEVYLGRRDRDVNKALFDALEKEKDAIEKEFGEELSWERLDAKGASRVAIYAAGRIEDDPAKLETTRAWGIDRLLRMKRVFAPRLTRLVATLGSTSSE